MRRFYAQVRQNKQTNPKLSVSVAVLTFAYPEAAVLCCVVLLCAHSRYCGVLISNSGV